MNLVVLVICTLFFLGCNPHTNSINKISKPGDLQHQFSDLRITAAELTKWDKIIREQLKGHPLQRRGDPYRLYAYLYYAQKLFADHSFAITNAYSGSLDSISLLVIKLFYPDFTYDKIKKDPFSEELSERIIKNIKSRFDAEQKQIREIQIPSKDGHWKGNHPVGLHYPMMKPWALDQPNEFKAPAPPPPNDPSWKKQLEETKKKSVGANDSQKQQSLFWERKIDPEAADWRYIAVKYMDEASIPLEMQLEARSKMMMALIDALIAVFQDKYTYLVQRPFMVDPKMKTLFTTPNHPSYPAAHGTMSAAAETVLAYYFPENEKEWKKAGNEARESRLWGGIHFPVDLKAGKKQGQQVGNAVLFRSPQ